MESIPAPDVQDAPAAAKAPNAPEIAHLVQSARILDYILHVVTHGVLRGHSGLRPKNPLRAPPQEPAQGSALRTRKETF